jgi:hypothetical protein
MGNSKQFFVEIHGFHCIIYAFSIFSGQLRKNESIFNCQSIKERGLIEITLPADQHDRYLECGYKPEKYKALNAVLSIPALVEAIGIIANDVNYPTQPSGLESKAWYKTIVVNLKRAAENKEDKYRQLLDKPFASAELLLGNNYATTLQYLSLVE